MLTILLLALSLPMQPGGTYIQEPGQPLVLSWYHDGDKSPRFRIWRNNAIILNAPPDMYTVEDADVKNCQVGARVCFLYTTKVTALPPIVQPGTYTMEVSAYNDVKESLRSPAITLTVRWASAPAVPAGVMLQKVELLPDGTWRIVK